MNSFIYAGIAVVVLIGGAFVWSQSQEGKTATDNRELLALTDSDHVKGEPYSSIQLVEYLDLQCPACAAYHPLVEQMAEEYADKVAFVTRHFPLVQIHPNAVPAAQAAEAAHLQGRFSDMIDLLFARQEEWSSLPGNIDTFTAYAVELGLDEEKFRSDMASDAVRDRVQKDLETGRALRITGTPAFFLGAEPLPNPRSVEDFRALLDAEIVKAESAKEG